MYTGYEHVELTKENPLWNKGKYSVSKLWKLYFEKQVDDKIVKVYSFSGYTSEEAAQAALYKSIPAATLSPVLP